MIDPTSTSIRNRARRPLFLTRLPSDEGSYRGSRKHARQAVERVIALKNEVMDCIGLDRLQLLAAEHLIALVKPDHQTIIFQPTAAVPPESRVIGPLVEAALTTGRMVYVPDISISRAIVNGDRPGERCSFFVLRPESLGIEMTVLRDSGFSSVAAVPLLTGLDNPDRPTAEFGRQGIIFLGWQERYPLSPSLHLVPLEIYAEHLANASLTTR